MQKKLNELWEKGIFRELKTLRQNGIYVEYEGKTYINCSSNDYLGISGMKNLQKEFFDSIDTGNFLMGALSSRLLTGNSIFVENFEKYVSELYGKECLMYNSGYHANTGILPAIAEKDDLIVADKLVHASIIDGIKLCVSDFKRYRHNDLSDLERILEQNVNNYKSIYIVTESIFSMDGDTASLKRLVELKEKYGGKLYVDEAHAFGAVGESGLGYAYNEGLIDKIEYTVCTLGKAAASEGAFVLCSSTAKQWLVNKSRTLIFTTAAPPVNVLWTHFIVKKIVEMKTQREHLQSITKRLRNKLVGWNIIGNTHIIPLIIGENDKCMQFAEKMRANGVWAMPVRYPSVPQGQSRIRLSLTAAMNSEHIDKIYESILA
ncbi:MAG: 8-amino-7-oxononanoate synthase [Prevotellaceae bacterium]|jgi:8-amino-7-oxononanoate synthase|nr:8-amino-7-oxononanoate synthase [Prevotellaceae bacterium]